MLWTSRVKYPIIFIIDWATNNWWNTIIFFLKHNCVYFTAFFNFCLFFQLKIIRFDVTLFSTIAANFIFYASSLGLILITQLGTVDPLDFVPTPLALRMQQMMARLKSILLHFPTAPNIQLINHQDQAPGNWRYGSSTTSLNESP